MRFSIAVHLLALLFGVKCAPNLGSASIPIKLGGQHSYNLALTNDGVDVHQHKESTSERNYHSERHINSSQQNYQRDDSSSHLSQDRTETDQFHDSHDSQRKTEDSGLNLGLSGARAYDNKKTIDDRSAFDYEKGRTESLRRDETANSGYNEESGSAYERTAKTQDHHEEYENKGLTVLGGRRVETNERGTSDDHDESSQKSASRWKNTQEYAHDGNGTRVSLNESSKAKESSAQQYQERDTIVYDHGDIQDHGDGSSECTEPDVE